jgi:hypothetical protein
LAIVDHPYKLPKKKIYERSEDNKNPLSSYYSDRSHGRRIEFLEKRIPTPVTKERINFKKVKEMFMDHNISMFIFVLT